MEIQPEDTFALTETDMSSPRPIGTYLHPSCNEGLVTVTMPLIALQYYLKMYV